MSDNRAFSFDITKACGVVSEGKGGWNKELNLVSWNGRKAKYDIRDWDPDHEKPGKGITLSGDELKQLGKLIDEEIKRLEEDEAHPASEITGKTIEGKNGQLSMEIKKADVSGAVDYNDL